MKTKFVSKNSKSIKPMKNFFMGFFLFFSRFFDNIIRMNSIKFFKNKNDVIFILLASLFIFSHLAYANQEVNKSDTDSKLVKTENESVFKKSESNQSVSEQKFKTKLKAPDGFNTSFICRFGADVRSLRATAPTAETKCKTFYTKSGMDQEIGTGTNPQSCLDIMTGVKDRIEAGGWKCKEVSNSVVSDLTP